MRAALAMLIVVIVAAGRPAGAEQTVMAPPTAAIAPDAPVRLVLVAPPPLLEAAVRAALAPWRVVILVERTAPPADIDAAEAVATERRAGAVAWMAPGQMVVYDAGADQLVERPVGEPGGELDDASAAALALTLKTLLRLPPEPPPPEPEPPVAVAPAVVAVAPPSRPAWRLGVLGGLRMRGSETEPRLTVLGERRVGPLAAELWAAFGGGFEVQSASFRGTWDDTAGGIAALLPVERGPWRVAPGLGASLHRTSIDGAFQGNGGDTEVPGPSIDVGLDAELGAMWRWRFAGAGARLAATYVLGREPFQTRGDNVVDVSAMEIEAAVGLFAVF